MKIELFERIRNWGKVRGIGETHPDAQYQRVLQEIVEIHEAMINNDEKEFQDAIGDSIVTLIMLAGTKGYLAEDCLNQAFDVIERRKGLTKNGQFIRYGKLSQDEKKICDTLQGNKDSEYFSKDSKLNEKNFKKETFNSFTERK